MLFFCSRQPHQKNMASSPCFGWWLNHPFEKNFSFPTVGATTYRGDTNTVLEIKGDTLGLYGTTADGSEIQLNTWDV